eukprot:120020-Alexandrium_andersonii.AAC.1
MSAPGAVPWRLEAAHLASKRSSQARTEAWASPAQRRATASNCRRMESAQSAALGSVRCARR